MAAEVEDVGAPLLVLAAPLVGMLVEGRAVEAAQRPVVLGEVPRHPVEDHPDARLVQPVDEVAQLVGASESGLRGEEAGDLVPPGRHEGVLGDGHELHVGVAHRRHVLDELVGQVQVRPALAPGAQVHLVDRQGGLLGGERATVGHPVVVAPRVGALVDDRGVRGSRLGETGHRVGLLPPYAVGAEDVVPVEGPLAHSLDEQRPHPSPGHQRERVAGPRVEVALDPDGLRIGRPDREPGSPDLPAIVVGDGDHMRAEQPPARGVRARVERCEVLTSQPTPGIMHASHSLFDRARTGRSSSRRGASATSTGQRHDPSLPPARPRSLVADRRYQPRWAGQSRRRRIRRWRGIPAGPLRRRASKAASDHQRDGDRWAGRTPASRRSRPAGSRALWRSAAGSR